MAIALYICKSSPRRIVMMKDLINMLEKIWISAAFAEAGEQDTARQLMGSEQYEAEAVETCHAA